MTSKDAGSGTGLERAIATRLLDQCVLDDRVLAALSATDSSRSVEVQRVSRRLALKRALRDMPILGPLARGFSQRLLQAKRFKS